MVNEMVNKFDLNKKFEKTLSIIINDLRPYDLFIT